VVVEEIMEQEIMEVLVEVVEQLLLVLEELVIVHQQHHHKEIMVHLVLLDLFHQQEVEVEEVLEVPDLYKTEV
jgi:hypothetical protein